MAQEKQDSTFKVIDRRLFTEEGELRPEAQGQVRREHEEQKSFPSAAGAPPTATTTAVVPGEAATQGAPAVAEAVAGEGPERSPHFEMLLNLIANQAAAMLGAYADPRTGQAVVDLEGAREFIDMLDALREKTLGNLTAEESATLTEVLGSLKYTFLEMTKAAAKARAGGAGPAPSPRR